MDNYTDEELCETLRYGEESELMKVTELAADRIEELCEKTDQLLTVINNIPDLVKYELEKTNVKHKKYLELIVTCLHNDEISKQVISEAIEEFLDDEYR